MRQTTRYSILLTAALIAFFLVASMMDSLSGQLIINLVALLPFPLVLYTICGVWPTKMRASPCAGA